MDSFRFKDRRCVGVGLDRARYWREPGSNCRGRNCEGGGSVGLKNRVERKGRRGKGS